MLMIVKQTRQRIRTMIPLPIQRIIIVLFLVLPLHLEA